MHDLSIFVGRKYYDKPTNDMDLNELLVNPNNICFGRLPQHTIDEYTELYGNLLE